MPLQSLANESTDCLSVLQNKSCPKIPSERKVMTLQSQGVATELEPRLNLPRDFLITPLIENRHL